MKMVLSTIGFSVLVSTAAVMKNEPQRHYTENEIVAATIILEAGGEYAPGAMEAVNEVINTRSLKRNLTKTEVCLQLFQFSCWNGRESLTARIATIHKAKKHPRWSLAMKIAKEPVTNYTLGADHYHADYIKTPYWAKSMSVTTKIGKHIFYK